MTTMAAGALALAACGPSYAGGGSASGGSSRAGGANPAGGASSSGATLATAHTSLGTVVVDPQGRTVYAFDKDTPGAGSSACTGSCANLWHPVTATSAGASADGVTGAVATTSADGGVRQVTLDGHRLYTYAGDSGPGQVSGEGVGTLWWVLSPSGQEIKAASSPSAPASSSAPAYTY